MESDLSFVGVVDHGLDLRTSRSVGGHLGNEFKCCHALIIS